MHESQQRELCAKFGASFAPSPLESKVGIAENTRSGVQPINGLPRSCARARLSVLQPGLPYRPQDQEEVIGRATSGAANGAPNRERFHGPTGLSSNDLRYRM